MHDVYIVSAVRTAIGRFAGMFKDLSPMELGSFAMLAALERARLQGAQLDLYIFGNVLRAGHGQLLPRQAAHKAGIPDSVDGYAIDMVCSSGMMSLQNAANMIRSEDAHLVLAGGFESMTQSGFMLSSRARWGYKILLGAPETITDVLLSDGLTDPMTSEAMGVETERLAREHKVGRKELDEWALLSQQRAVKAAQAGIFAREIVPVEVKTKKGLEKLSVDEGVRADTTMETLAALKPAFFPDGVLTAGNSSQISDGAAALLLASKNAVERHNLRPIGKILAGAWSAGETWRFPEAPIPAVKKLLEKLKMKISDFDLFENNEAFALSSVLFERQLDVAREKLNVHGGAIALGHPLGASGARLIVTILNALETRDKTFGLASICHGTGGATALAVERLGSAEMK